MKGLNELNDAAIIKFVETKRFDEVTAALAILTNVPTALIAKVLEGHRADLVLIPCKSAGLRWQAVETILTRRPVKPQIDERTLKIATTDYGKLSIEDRAAHAALLAGPRQAREAILACNSTHLALGGGAAELRGRHIAVFGQ